MTTIAIHGSGDNLTTIDRHEIPLYLRNSNLYLSLAEEEEEETHFSVPPEFCKPPQEIRSRRDLEQLLETLSYWISNELPRELVDYALSKDIVAYDDLFEKYERTLPELRVLREVVKDDGSNVFWTIAKHDSVSLMKLFKERGEVGIDKACVGIAAIESGHVGCLQYAHEHGCEIHEEACALAGKQGHFLCLKYAHEHGAALPEKLCEVIAGTGKLDCLKYAHKHGCALSPTLMSTVTRAHCWDCVKYCHENGQTLDSITCAEATRDNRLDILMYAHQHGCELAGTAYIAMSLGRLDCFKYAYAQDPKVRQVFAEVAAGGGHLECLKYALELHTTHNVPLSDKVCSSAAWKGKLDCLQCAHNAGCSWDERTCEAAATNGHLECLKYAHENGCSWGAKTAKLAVSNANRECWEYLYANNGPGALHAYWVPVVLDYWDSFTLSRIL